MAVLTEVTLTALAPRGTLFVTLTFTTLCV